MDPQQDPLHPPTAPGINAWNAPWVADMQQRWLDNPQAVPESWRHFFAGFELGAAREPSAPAGGGIDRLIDDRRRFGHLAADLDPLGLRPLPRPCPDLESFGFSAEDLKRPLDAGDLPMPGPATPEAIDQRLRQAWCGTLGVESEHIRCDRQRSWWRRHIESPDHLRPLSPESRRRILLGLQQATGLERFLMRRYVGSKWFSLEGCETLIPMIAELLDTAASDDVGEVAFGMAHRGRVNVLVNILEKSYDQLFTEFEEAWTEDFVESGGDVKYHRGYSSNILTASDRPLHLTMASNPSHLEWGHPVVLGRIRAKQRLRGDTNRAHCLPVLIHGDAALPGQGVVQELANMAELPPYDVGGSIHIIVNNQIGFTAEHEEAFASVYCTDVLRGQDIPILHVNAADPDQCIRAARLAVRWRQEFGRDVAIDLWGWRRYGHNETDEPAFTNPAMYQAVKAQPAIVEHYAATLAADGVIEAAEAEQAEQHLLEVMDQAQQRIRNQPVRPTPPAFDDSSTWAGFEKAWDGDTVDTSVPREELERIAAALGRVPDGFTPHPKLAKVLEQRQSAIEEDLPLDWAMGELLAYGSLLLDGYPIRLTGEDCQRGTFSHRHAVLFDATSGEFWSPLDHIDTGQSRMCIHNSPVTESACIGFEYGYSLGDPNMLVVWEAQFGDFANVGQVYFDQFIASAERKWKRNSGLVCLLPHGYEGMGPEHSSARLERFLQLCADENMEVVVPTTPAQMFHLLRRQMRRAFRKPLIVLTPKSLLRHKQAVSTALDLTHGRFQCVLDDPAAPDPASVSKVLFCAGKVGWDLIAHRAAHAEDQATAIVRIEQLYPFPRAEVANVLNHYAAAEQHVWVQEEPHNAGAWTWIADTFRSMFSMRLDVASRPANASPAVGSARLHRVEQEAVLREALQTGSQAAMESMEHKA
ncbi:MAG: 2-oxoglutarate dehydrogenase E1 component [Phycisphaerales bacterium]|jgi:2-oxoglutarate dehydrogenase E1 component|nr:2-oxoglutarate dehydrogenase E1 component [Phycisphaerales bacterium]